MSVYVEIFFGSFTSEENGRWLTETFYLPPQLRITFFSYFFTFFF